MNKLQIITIIFLANSFCLNKYITTAYMLADITQRMTKTTSTKAQNISYVKGKQQ